ncbi:alpha/beta hydrolase [Pseudofrankia asymbiotica]|nr:alpha/beta hydrolase [Pseudofrankia asymbiotica]
MGRRAIMRVDRDGIGVYADLAGPADGRPVVFLHGAASSGTVWDWLPPAVTADRRIVKVDFRGHGRSDRAPDAYLLPDFADDIAVVLRDIVGGPATLVGHSLGGAVAWAVAQRHPDLVTALLLGDPPLFRGSRADDASSPAGTVFARIRSAADQWQREGVSIDEISKRLARTSFDPGSAPTMGVAYTGDAVEATAFSLKHVDVRVIDAVLDGSMLAALDTSAPVPVPVLLLAADEALGAVFTTAHAKQLAEDHPSAEVVHLTGAGHWIHLERRTRPVFTRHLVDFLARHS